MNYILIKMKNLAFWKRFLNISTYGLGVLVILHILFKKYIAPCITVVWISEIILLTLSLVSEFVVFLIKRKLKKAFDNK
jgi:hypothetical protein